MACVLVSLIAAAEDSRARWGTAGSEVAPSEGLPQSGPQMLPFQARSMPAGRFQIRLPDAAYMVLVPPLPKKSSLGKVKAGDSVDCAVEGKTVYLRDEKGAVYRGRIRP